MTRELQGKTVRRRVERTPGGGDRDRDVDHQGPQAGNHRPVPARAERHRLARGADRPAHRSHQRAARAHADPQEGPRQPARPAQDGQQAIRPAELSPRTRTAAAIWPSSADWACASNIRTGPAVRRPCFALGPPPRPLASDSSPPPGDRRPATAPIPPTPLLRRAHARHGGIIRAGYPRRTSLRRQHPHPRNRQARQAGPRGRRRPLRRHHGPRRRRRGRRPTPGSDFFPLTVDYREKTYAAGKFPGGFIKREGRPTTKEILTSRLIDRPIRPLFPADYFNEVQIMATHPVGRPRERPRHPLHDRRQRRAARLADPVPAGHRRRSASAASTANWSSCRPHAQMEESDLDLIVAGTRKAITMIEGFAREMSEEHDARRRSCSPTSRSSRVIDMIEELRTRRRPAGRRSCPPPPAGNPLIESSASKYGDEFTQRKQTAGKADRADAVKRAQGTHRRPSSCPRGEEPSTRRRRCPPRSTPWKRRVVRDLILDGKRIDGRGTKQIRADLLRGRRAAARRTARPCSSAARRRRWSRSTLGTVSDEQRVDGLVDEYSKKFMLDYNFPPFSRRRVQADPRPGPSRDRPRRAGRAVAQGGPPDAGQVPLHDPRRLRHPRVERLVAAWPRSAAAPWP